MDETAAKGRPSAGKPVRLTRTLHAPCDTVFAAWCAAEHVERWFAPTGYSVPKATVEPRVGGRFEVCMRAPDGTIHWSRGTFVECVPPERIVLDLTVSDGKGLALFRAFTEVSLADALGGTRLDVAQTYTILDPAAAWMTEGAPLGWAQTVDKLGEEVARMRRPDAAQRSVVHGAFTLERTYDAPIERVYRALSDEAAKAKWFSGDEGQWTLLARRMDFRVGGREHLKGCWQGGGASTFDAVYFDIVPNARIVYAYEMHLDDRKISVSLATLQLTPAGEGRAKLTVTEQGAFLDGYDDAGSRERGTGFLLDRLGASLKD